MNGTERHSEAPLCAKATPYSREEMSATEQVTACLLVLLLLLILSHLITCNPHHKRIKYLDDKKNQIAVNSTIILLMHARKYFSGSSANIDTWLTQTLNLSACLHPTH